MNEAGPRGKGAGEDTGGWGCAGGRTQGKTLRSWGYRAIKLLKAAWKERECKFLVVNIIGKVRRERACRQNEAFHTQGFFH